MQTLIQSFVAPLVHVRNRWLCTLLLLLFMLLSMGTLQPAYATANAQATADHPCAANVAEAATYTLVYQLAIPANSDYTDAPVPYAIDNSATISGYQRVAYCLQLDDQWVWVSMDDFTGGVITQTGVPVRSVTPGGFQQVVANMNVDSNVPGVVTGDAIATGNIEFWQNCYNRPSLLGLAGANDALYDFDDSINPDAACDGWGSMQVHNHGASQTVFGYSGWDDAQVDGIGISNNPADGSDWTFAANAENFTTRTLWVFVNAATAPQPIHYVDAAATGSATGDSWANAYLNVQDALQVAVSGDQIWIAQGVYYPDQGGGKNEDDQTASFIIPAGVGVYGGFAPSAGVDEFAERDWTRYPTVLSGDIGQDDTLDLYGAVASASDLRGSNSYHVVYLDGSTTAITATTVIDGLVVTAGNAVGNEVATLNGGGLLCQGKGGECSPTITKVLFSGNAAGDSGGAVKNDGTNGLSNPTFVDVIFRGNSAKFGGAMHNDGRSSGVSSPVLVNVVFSGNAATNWGGAIVNEGAGGASSPALTNVTFSGNRAASGGAIYNRGEGGSSSPTLKNVILWQNRADDSASIFNNNANLTLLNSIIEGDADGIATSGASAIAYTGNNASDPRFVQPVDPANAPTSRGDLRLRADSSAIDLGDSSALPATVTTDLAGAQRIVNAAVEAGAYERQPQTLLLAAPDGLPGLIANLEATMQPLAEYDGYAELSFALIEAPPGMTIDLSTGLIRWTPQRSDEGQRYTVGVAVNDGSRFAETRFQVTVLAPEPINVAIEGNVLRVVDESTTLNGMTITQLEGEPMLATLDLGKLDAAVAPAPPEWVSPLSDVLVVRSVMTHAVELRFPLAGLPEAVSLGDVDLYAFTEALDVEGQLWAPVWMAINYEGTAEAPVIAVQLDGLAGMALWGHDATEAVSASSAQRVAKMGLAAPIPQPATPTCVQQAAFGNPIDTYLCTTTAVTVTIKGWGTDLNRWKGPNLTEAGATKENFVSWLIDAQSWFSAAKLGYSVAFNVSIEQIQSPGLGYVTGAEDYRTLHINADNSLSASTLQGTTVHEYFHHAQANLSTQMADKVLLIRSGSNTGWLVEGTARWVEDELFDSMNTYVGKEGNWGQRITEAGISNAGGADGGGKGRPYQRFSFFKLLTGVCPNFLAQFRASLNLEPLAAERSGLTNLVSLFGPASGNFACNFGDHLGTSNSATLSAALAYYNYASQRQGKIALLDANELTADGTDVGFQFDKPTYTFTPQPTTVEAWLALPNTTLTLTINSAIPAAGAYSFNVPAIAGTLPAGKVAELHVTGSSVITVSLTGQSGQFTGTNTIGAGADLAPHAWFTTTKQPSYVYSVNGAVPALFVTLVNGSLTQKVDNVKVTLRLRNELTTTADIASHQNGAQVSNRVVTITGTIPAEVRGTTTHVRVTVNGIATDTPLQPDGAFVVQGIMALGDNTLTAQGIGTAGPTTLEALVTVQGVESTVQQRNALITSRAVFVLRWDTNQSDVDIYTTDKSNGAVWFENLNQGPGTLDYDDTDGLGPEVVSYRVTDDEIYVNGTITVSLHYYDAHGNAQPANFTLNVVLNETDSNNRRVLEFRSVTPLITADSGQKGPAGAGPSRFNGILRITCSAERICSLDKVDASRLAKP